METEVISLACLPPYAVSRLSPLLLDEVFDDFDAQAARLVDHDQRYLQLTPGPFRGRFLSAMFGPDVSLHVEVSDQALFQDIGGSADCFTFCVTLADGAGFATNGRRFGSGEVLVLPPRGTLAMRSPAGGCIAALVIRQEAFLSHPVLTPALGDWLCGIGRSSAQLLAAPTLADRLRSDCRDALDHAATSDIGAAPSIGQALLSSLAAGLSLGLHGKIAIMPPHRWLTLFQDWRRADPGARLPIRQVEKSVSAVAGLGPMSLLRLERLHRARRILQSGPSGVSIGDIAASCGFADWSRFTAAYGQQFGERPSQTRQRAAASAHSNGERSRTRKWRDQGL